MRKQGYVADPFTLLKNPSTMAAQLWRALYEVSSNPEKRSLSRKELTEHFNTKSSGTVSASLTGMSKTDPPMIARVGKGNYAPNPEFLDLYLARTRAEG